MRWDNVGLRGETFRCRYEDGLSVAYAYRTWDEQWGIRFNNCPDRTYKPGDWTLQDVKQWVHSELRDRLVKELVETVI